MTQASEVTVPDAEVSWFDKRYEELRAQYPENVIECQRRTMQEWLADRVPDAVPVVATLSPDETPGVVWVREKEHWNNYRAAVLRGPG